jgi:raffinose/stachyose/melibiose transport system permease protein/N-acetylglucosamine transport system permease protein
VSILNFLGGWNEFYYALIFIKEKAARTVPLGLLWVSGNATMTAQWADLFAALMISIVPVLLVFALLQEQITKGLTLGALQGQ